MHVHAFARRFPSLSQTFVLGQCTGLFDLGLELTIFADGADGTGLVHPDVLSSGVLDHTRHHRIPEPWFHRPARALRLLLSEESLSVRQRLELLDPRLGGREALSGRLLFEGAAVARERRPDILHAHFGPVGAMVASLRAAGVVDAPLVTTFYGYDVSRTPPVQYRRLFKTGDAFLVLSEAMRHRLVAIGAPASRVFVHRLGVDITRFTPAPPRAADTDGTMHLLSIARLVPKKGLADALRAVAALRTHIPGVRYSIVGDGPLRGTLEAQAQSLGIASLVHFAGWLTAPEVITLAHTAHALLAPSVTAPDGDAEGTPVAILEAQALGLPVVATRHAGIPEVVEDGVTAFLAAEHDLDALVEAIIRLADPRLRARMGEAGRSLVERHHDIATLNLELLARYEGLFSR